MTVVPVFGPDSNGRFVGPLTGLKLSRVKGYGNVELSNPASSGVAIVPLHMGYIQDGAQNHALCRSAFIAAGQKRMFNDACCVQAAQGGYLEGREQWFFILPVQLRNEALERRGQVGYNKIWDSISQLNREFGLRGRGHLEQIISRSRAMLTQYRSRFELMQGQTGALFFIREKLAGVEIAPTASYFQEMWMPLVCFAYGVAAMSVEKRERTNDEEIRPFEARTLLELREKLRISRLEQREEVGGWLAHTPPEQFKFQEEERYVDLKLHTVAGVNFAGQVVEEDGKLLYASLFAKPQYLQAVG
ncbi:MAG: DUF6569 family protein [Chloroflexia bacterium]